MTTCKPVSSFLLSHIRTFSIASPEPFPREAEEFRLLSSQYWPWRYHNWQHIHDPEQFLQRARPVLRLYIQALSLLKQGIWLVCLDEKTSIQAREGEEPPRPAKEGSSQLQASRYHRHGALNLFAGLSVADGKVYQTFHTRKRFVDFQSFVEQTIIPEALDRRMHTVNLIVDNGTTHARHPTGTLVATITHRARRQADFSRLLVTD